MTNIPLTPAKKKLTYWKRLCRLKVHKIHCLEEDFAKTRKKSDETVTEKRCDARRQISEMEY